MFDIERWDDEVTHVLRVIHSIDMIMTLPKLTLEDCQIDIDSLKRLLYRYELWNEDLDREYAANVVGSHSPEVM